MKKIITKIILISTLFFAERISAVSKEDLAGLVHEKITLLQSNNSETELLAALYEIDEQKIQELQLYKLVEQYEESFNPGNQATTRTTIFQQIKDLAGNEEEKQTKRKLQKLALLIQTRSKIKNTLTNFKTMQKEYLPKMNAEQINEAHRVITQAFSSTTTIVSSNDYLSVQHIDLQILFKKLYEVVVHKHVEGKASRPSSSQSTPSETPNKIQEGSRNSAPNSGYLTLAWNATTAATSSVANYAGRLLGTSTTTEIHETTAPTGPDEKTKQLTEAKTAPLAVAEEASGRNSNEEIETLQAIITMLQKELNSAKAAPKQNSKAIANLEEQLRGAKEAIRGQKQPADDTLIVKDIEEEEEEEDKELKAAIAASLETATMETAVEYQSPKEKSGPKTEKLLKMEIINLLKNDFRQKLDENKTLKELLEILATQTNHQFQFSKTNEPHWNAAIWFTIWGVTVTLLEQDQTSRIEIELKSIAKDHYCKQDTQVRINDLLKAKGQSPIQIALTYIQTLQKNQAVNPAKANNTLLILHKCLLFLHPEVKKLAEQPSQVPSQLLESAQSQSSMKDQAIKALQSHHTPAHEKAITAIRENLTDERQSVINDKISAIKEEIGKEIKETETMLKSAKSAEEARTLKSDIRTFKEYHLGGEMYSANQGRTNECFFFSLVQSKLKKLFKANMPIEEINLIVNSEVEKRKEQLLEYNGNMIDASEYFESISLSKAINSFDLIDSPESFEGDSLAFMTKQALTIQVDFNGRKIPLAILQIIYGELTDKLERPERNRSEKLSNFFKPEDIAILLGDDNLTVGDFLDLKRKLDNLISQIMELPLPTENTVEIAKKGNHIRKSAQQKCTEYLDQGLKEFKRKLTLLPTQDDVENITRNNDENSVRITDSDTGDAKLTKQLNSAILRNVKSAKPKPILTKKQKEDLIEEANKVDINKLTNALNQIRTDYTPAISLFTQKNKFPHLSYSQIIANPVLDQYGTIVRKTILELPVLQSLYDLEVVGLGQLISDLKSTPTINELFSKEEVAALKKLSSAILINKQYSPMVHLLQSTQIIHNWENMTLNDFNEQVGLEGALVKPNHVPDQVHMLAQMIKNGDGAIILRQPGHFISIDIDKEREGEEIVYRNSASLCINTNTPIPGVHNSLQEYFLR